MSYKITTDIFKKQIYNLVKEDYSVLGEYINVKTKILFKHNICGNEYETTPNNFKAGYRCPFCSHNFKKDTEYFKNEVCQLTGNEYEVLGEYKGRHHKIEMYHNNCNNSFITTPSGFIRGNRCAICSKKIKLTTSQFKQEMFDLVDNEYEVISEYKGRHYNIEIKHNLCGNIFEMQPSCFLRGERCPKCGKKNMAIKNTKTDEYFKEEIYSLFGDDFTILGKYIKDNQKILVRHNKCNHEWYVSPHNLLQGSGCPKCKESKGEKIIQNILIKKGFIKINNKDYNKLDNVFKNNYYYFIPQKKFDGLKGLKNGNLSYDFYLPNLKYNLLIEYDGRYHFEPIKKNKYEPLVYAEERLRYQQEHDRRKDEYAKNNNIILLRIPYWNFGKIEEILDDYLVQITKDRYSVLEKN